MQKEKEKAFLGSLYLHLQMYQQHICTSHSESVFILGGLMQTDRKSRSEGGIAPECVYSGCR
jgi:hypothetical protein